MVTDLTAQLDAEQARRTKIEHLLEQLLRAQQGAGVCAKNKQLGFVLQFRIQGKIKKGMQISPHPFLINILLLTDEKLTIGQLPAVVCEP